MAPISVDRKVNMVFDSSVVARVRNHGGKRVDVGEC